MVGLPSNVPSRFRGRALAAASAALLIAGAWMLLADSKASLSLRSAPTAGGSTSRESSSGPPWRYGRADARFTVIEFADLECPYCRAYFGTLKVWIDKHPEVNWQWHHLPLSMHEPAASNEARLVECVGSAQGSTAFWHAVEWVYAHTRGDGQGVPEGVHYPELTSAVRRCLERNASAATIRAQAAQAVEQGASVTPTLRLKDRKTGRTLLLHGPVEGDALLSAIDLLAAGGPEATSPNEMPAESLGDIPR